jgi:3-hydroxyisobutyrate dehydrogenase-like beta-hydroxyacid dehydrogenase
MQEFTVGFIGLGIMGESMCENIIKKSGKPVFVFDVNSAQVTKLVGLGGKACKDIPELAKKCTLIFIMVPRNEHVRDVISQLLPNIATNTIIVDMSTISPQVSREMAEKVRKAGSIMLDAPVVKSKAAAISGALGILVGGNQDMCEKIKPYLLMMGSEVTYLGKNGNGLALKLIHNMLVGNIQNGVNEALLMVESAGLDFDASIKGIKSGGAQTFYMDSKADSIHKGDFSPKFSVQNMHKDVWLHKELSDELKLDLPGADRVRKVYDETMKDSANEDFSSTIKTVRKICKKK